VNYTTFEILTVGPDEVIIRDTSSDSGGPTVTNDAEAVVKQLLALGVLKGRRLFYFDSEGALDEIKVQQGRFAGFGPGPGRKR
jgi:hypothetical protein